MKAYLSLSKIQQEVIIFIDEFEKVYQEYSSEVLTIMDGENNKNPMANYYKNTHKVNSLFRTMLKK